MPEQQRPSEARGADIEIWEDWPDAAGYDKVGVIAPRRITINGTELLTPADRPIIELGPVDGKNVLTATVNLFVRSLTIHPVEFNAPEGYKSPERLHDEFQQRAPSYAVHFKGSPEELLAALSGCGHEFSVFGPIEKSARSSG